MSRIWPARVSNALARWGHGPIAWCVTWTCLYSVTHHGHGELCTAV